MFARHSMIRILLLASCLALGCHGYRQRNAFQDFFPDVRDELRAAVHNNCSREFALYRAERVTLHGEHCVRMFSCVMSVATEYTKANFASAAVLLGLTPTILATVGSTTPELALLASRRPALTFLIVLGSPAVNALRALDYNKSIVEFQRAAGRAPAQAAFRVLAASAWLRWVCVAVEFLVALAAVANLAQLSFIINRNTIVIMSCDNRYMLVELWIGLAVVTHLGGIAAFFSRSPPLYVTPRQGLYALRRWARNEFSPCAVCAERVVWDRENSWFVALSWFVTLFTVLHLTFGTLIFSSLYFIGTPYAAYIVARFAASAIACRILVAFEIAGMKAIRDGDGTIGEAGVVSVVRCG